MSDTFDLADEPLEPEPKSKREPAQPLKRLWKEEPDPSDDESEPTATSPNDNATEQSKKPASAKAPSTKAKAKSTKDKGTGAADGQGVKRVLIEETPTLDTYESRRKARFIMGGLSVACLFLFMWIVYSAFLYDPVGIDASTGGDPSATQVSAEVRPSLEQEARFMFNRAKEFARSDKPDQAVAMLTRVVKVYKDTPSAKDSKAALDRAAQKLPLFSDSPVVVAQAEEPKPAPGPAAPPAVVDATPAQPQTTQGQAALVLPANPAEAMVTPPGTAAPAGPTPKTSAYSVRPIPSGFQANLDAGVHDSGWPFVIVGDRDGAPMVLVPGGTFKMGNNEGQTAEAPEHSVRLSTYYIDQHEVTNRQFRTFLGESHYHGQPAGKWLTDEKARAEPDAAPAVHVNFQDAEAFAAWAGKLIPTESQWEMAARSADGRRFPWGDESARWSKARVFHQIDPVMSFPEDKSPLGVFDMAGNAQEWTRDWFDYRYYSQLHKTIADNPAGPARSRTGQHVVRGAAKNWSVTYREGVPADRRLPYLGFRCVLVVESAPPTPAPVNAAAPAPGAPPTAAPKAVIPPF